MATATKTKQQTKPVTFRSRSRNLRVVIEPRYRKAQTAPNGHVVGWEETDGKQVVFKNWILSTEDREVIEALRSDKRYGNERSGWVEVFDANRPSVEDRLEAIADLAIARDANGLRSLLADEEAGGDGGRARVLDAARSTIDKLSAKPKAKTAEAESTAKSDDGARGDPGPSGS